MISSRLTDGKGFYPIESVRVIDGDAIECNVMLPLGAVVKKRIRLKGWWADEVDGLYASDGIAAKEALTEWCRGKALWIGTPSGRLDRYGRIVAVLVHHEALVDPKAVLGRLQLTEKEHKRRRDLIGKRAESKREGAWGGCDSRPPY